MKEYRKTMLIAPDDVKAISMVNYNVSDDIIGNAIRTSQEIYLEEILGTDLYHKVQLLVYNSIVGEEDNIEKEENTFYATLLDEYIEPFLIAKTAVECLMPLTFKVRNLGVVKDNDTNINSISIEELKNVITYNETQVCTYATRLSRFLDVSKDFLTESGINYCCNKNNGLYGKIFANIPLYLGNNNYRRKFK